MRTPRRGRSFAVVVSAGLALAGCSSSTPTGGPSGPKLSGPPVVVGLINMENATAGSFPELRRGAEAAAGYVNASLGGVGGRPLRLSTCVVDGSPESSQRCVNRLLGQSPVAVIGGFDLGADPSLSALEKAGVPYVTGTPASAGAMTSSDSFALTGGTAGEILGEVSYAVGSLGAKRVGVVYEDVPGLVATAASLLDRILNKQGVEAVKLVPAAAGAPDLTPALSSVQSIRPDTVLVAFPAQSCARVMQATVAAGVTANVFYPSICAERRALSAAGGGAEGAWFAAGYTPWVARSDPDVETYLAQLRRYDPQLQPSLLSQSGFATVMDIRQLLNELGGRPVTAASLRAVLLATRDHPSFMGHPYTCDRKQVPVLSSVCSMRVRVFRYRGGTLEPVGDWVDGTSLVKSLSG